LLFDNVVFFLKEKRVYQKAELFEALQNREKLFCEQFKKRSFFEALHFLLCKKCQLLLTPWLALFNLHRRLKKRATEG
jgi:hypothetical protein